MLAGMDQERAPAAPSPRRRFSYLRLNVALAGVGSWVAGGLIVLAGIVDSSYASTGTGTNDVLGGLILGFVVWYLIRALAEAQRIFLENADNLRIIAQHAAAEPTRSSQSSPTS